MRRETIKLLAGSQIFTVIFVKKDGTERTMNCRLGVKAHLSPGSRGLSINQKIADIEGNFLKVYDLQKKAYRTINCNTILEIKIKGKTITP